MSPIGATPMPKLATGWLSGSVMVCSALPVTASKNPTSPTTSSF